jgi:DNA-binding NarL/FixJ family response regulator
MFKMNKQPIKVLVIDDHQLIINGLKSILQDEEDVTFAGGANNMEQAMAFLEQFPVDVVLTDISIPGTSGIEITRKIKELYPEIQVLALTMHEDITMISNMIEAGASGYILKRSNMNEILDAVRVVAEKGKYLGRDVQSILMDNLGSKDAVNELPGNLPASLTSREKEILKLIAKELSNEEIANKLFISERTVETHRRNIFTKTKTKTIVGLIKYAIKYGFVSQENDPAKASK